MNLAEFIDEFKETITEQTMRNYQPLYVFDISPFQNKIQKLHRRPFMSQSHAISGLVKCYQEGERSAFLVGEMGVGKTLIGAAVPYVAGLKKILVLCPPHLVKKWQREIKSTVPNARVFILRSMDDVDFAMAIASEEHMNYFILSRERAKLNYRWRPAYVRPVISSGRRCEHMVSCPTCGEIIKDKEGIPVFSNTLYRKKLFCCNEVAENKLCNAPLWQADNTGIRRFSLAEYIKKYHGKYFDILVLDECHEYKAQGSAQGYAMATLADICTNVLAMTGTLLGGYSTSLFYLLYRLTSDFKREYKHTDSILFAQRYGVLERVFKEKGDWTEDGASSKRRTFSKRTVERPGISPEIISYIINRTVFLRLSDVAEALPSYVDIIEIINMKGEQLNEYKLFSETLYAELKKEIQKGSRKLLGAYLQSLLAYPDMPWRGEKIYTYEGDQSTLVAEAPALSKDVIYPKERKLLELCLSEKKQGRKSIVYCTNTGKRDITGRLQELLEKKGLKVIVLKAHTVPSEKREDWIKQKVKEGIDVLICQPKLVQTGLDLIDFPTLIFYQVEYSVYTVRQASRRSWRIGQEESVKVYYFAYATTIQEKGLKLIAEKVKASLMVEGELIPGGLSFQTGSDDMMTQLAKSLMDSSSTKESAEELFSSCREAFTASQSFIGHEMGRWEDQESIVNEESPTVGLLWDDLKVGVSTKRHIRKKISNSNQLTLYF